ncbi:MAG: metallophosphoesterase [Gordonia sp. (in: high G+C Gram-positive bacteria)]|uniref:metallophosphoesterase n=1 Tax=Gordonia sp. (in: high G+C Gram-positive bacteria) TaxID=84139 RepID=UPI0039E45436
MTDPHTYFVIPDVHAQLDVLDAALELVDLDDPGTRLIQLGDLVDRGPDSLACLARMRDLDTGPNGSRVTVLRGNHEEWFRLWLEAPEDSYTWLYADPMLQTVSSFLPDIDKQHLEKRLISVARNLDKIQVISTEVRDQVIEAHPWLPGYLDQMPFFYEHEHFIAVHAGLDEEAGEHALLGADPVAMIEKYPPSFGAHDVGKLIVAGHVWAQEIRPDERADPYLDEGHLYLDGGPERPDGQLNLCRFDASSRDWFYRAVTAGGITEERPVTRTDR